MKKKLIIIIAVIVVVLLGAAAGVYFLFFAPEDTSVKTCYYTPGDYFVTNVYESEMLLKMLVVLATDKDQSVFFEKHIPMIRNHILFELREMTVDEFKDPNLEQTFSDTMTQKLNAALGVDYISRIYISDLVLQ